jgi:hypothetical protein
MSLTTVVSGFRRRVWPEETGVVYGDLCRIEEDESGKWILRNAKQPHLKWAGSRWAEVSNRADPRLDISRFNDEEEAESYAEERGFAVVKGCETPQ